MKAVVVHRGARDAYQVAAALSEAGLLECLVTDLYWPNDQSWASRFASRLNASAQQMLLARYSPLLPSLQVIQTLGSGLISHLLDKLPSSPFSWRRGATRWTDAVMGRTAGTRARVTDSTLLSYSYYGFHAFSTYGSGGMLFQAHPHPTSVRRILQQELEAHPECAESLRKEWELSLADEDFEHLVAETSMAAHILAASSFTRQTLIENGTSANAISVIPYGVDLTRFSPGPTPTQSGPFKLLFVGTINQRKGIKYLLDAIRLLDSPNLQLTVCGRVWDDLSIFKPFGSKVTVMPSVSASELLQAYRTSDLFVFPSVAEGFGQVLLESLACGLPILSTTRTAAPDLITEGREGFIVEPCRPDLLAEKIEWCMAHRAELLGMRGAAAAKGASFTWARFRRKVVESVLSFQASRSAALASEVTAQYV